MKLFVVSGLLMCGAVQAASVGDIPQVRVSYDDLNLNRPMGVNILLARIERAAEGVCHQFEGRLLSLQAKFGACVGKAVGDAVQTVNDRRLTAAYLQKRTGRAG
jgi:UrcA family protein